MGVTIRRAGVDELELVEPLWSSLREHHAAVTPEEGPPRSRADSWARRRAQYEAWLAQPDAFVLVAERDGAAVAYAMVHIDDGESATWPFDKRVAELETLAVLPGERGAGVGKALLDAVRARIAEQGIDELGVHAIASNRDAIRFYERHGFRTFSVHMWSAEEQDVTDAG